MENTMEIDEAFVHLHEKIAAYCNEMIVIQDIPRAIQMQVRQLEINTPVEMDIITNENGEIEIGAVPPLYHLATTIEPVFHQIRFRIDVKKKRNGK